MVRNRYFRACVCARLVAAAALWRTSCNAFHLVSSPKSGGSIARPSHDQSAYQKASREPYSLVTASGIPSSARIRRSGSLEVSMAGSRRGDDGGAEEEKGRVGKFLSGALRGAGGYRSKSKKDKREKTAGGDGGEGPGIRSFTRKFLQRAPKEKREGQGIDSGVEVDIDEFIGPRFPIDTKLGRQAALARQEDDKKRIQRVRIEMQEKRKAQLNEQAILREAEKKRAQERARKIAEERKKKMQKQKEAQERRSAVTKAAQKPKKASSTAGIAGEKRDLDDAGQGGPAKPLGSAIRGAQSFVSGVWDSVVKTDEEWIVVCPKTRISPGEVVPLVAGGLDLLVVASRDGRKVHAIANSCPHLGTPLETGLMEQRPKPGTVVEDKCLEDCIVCPLHNTAFELESGEVRGEWCPYPPVIGKMMGAIKPKANLVKFEIRTSGKNIEVRINTSLDDKGNGKRNTLISR